MTRTMWCNAMVASLVLAGCSSQVKLAPPGDRADLATTPIMTFGNGPDLAQANQPQGSDICGDTPADPACMDTGQGPTEMTPSTFPLQSDPNKKTNENDQGVNRDPMGYLGLDSTHASFFYVWIANSQENTTSKLDSKTVRELARYWTTTCYSNPGKGSTAACDGVNGCCTVDDWPRYQARKNKQNQPGHQPVQIGRVTPNYPSRTAVDLNGDLFISNRAFGSQSSVTKIANDPSECIDRNHNGKIDTSSDTNGDGFIETDCNGDGMFDDIASVQAKPCTNGLKQEFYGDDDECVLWTSNTFINGDIGRPLGLAQGAVDANNSDAWAGAYQDGTFVRIDGTTGLDKDDTKVGNNPYGLAVDANGIAWAGPLGGPTLCYFDTNKSASTACARTPNGFSVSGYGVTLDRDQNVWIGAGVMRYTPDRTNGFNSLGNGFWMKISGVNGIGIAADARNANAYWVWSCNGSAVLQIPASTIPMPGKNGQPAADFQVPPNGWTTINMPCYGVGVDADQNIWGVDMQTSTRAVVDVNGKVTQPNVLGQPMGNNKCPAGDSCPNSGAYTYSDFTGFGLRNFTRPTGSYSMVVAGCADAMGNPLPTKWDTVTWDADVPPNTTLEVHARSANVLSIMDPSWNTAVFSTSSTASPLLLQNNLTPNLADTDNQSSPADGFLDIEFLFKTQDQNATPKLKSFDVGYKCPAVIP